MTQEQNKPVRSRDEQAEEIFSAFRGVTHTDGSQFLPHLGRQDLLNALAEAEARGAAEQRRKDGEGQDPVAWIFHARLRGTSAWRTFVDTNRPEETPSNIRNVSPLYTRHANVAALGARVKELKEALVIAVRALEQVKDGERGGYNARNGKFVSLQMSDGERADIIHSDVTTECEGALETARAALTREGGV